MPNLEKILLTAQQAYLRRDFLKAEENLLRVLRKRPKLIEVHYNLAQTREQLRKFPEAIASYGQVIKREPSHLKALLGLGRIYGQANQLALSADFYHRAATHHEDSQQAWRCLGKALTDLGNLDSAKEILEIAVEEDPENGDGHTFLAQVYELSGDIPRVLGQLKEAERCGQPCDPRPLLCDSETSLSDLYEKTVARALPHPPLKLQTKKQKRNTEKPFHVGFFAPYFKAHAAANFLEPLLHLEKAAAGRFEFFFYDDTRPLDDINEKYRKQCQNWRQVQNLGNEQFAETLLADDLDLLIDFDGITDERRMPVLRAKPARKMMAWFGYPATNGIPEYDARISDCWIDPPESQKFSSEPLFYLHSGSHCYTPLYPAPEPIVKKPDVSRPFCFGSFNHSRKLNDYTLKLWADVLLAVPNSRLLLKDMRFSHDCVKNRVSQKLQEYGIGADRLELRVYADNYQSHLAMYNEVDIALDPFPHNGITTIGDATIMAVPTVTLYGETPPSRVGLSFFTRLSLEKELVADNAASYVEKAGWLANHPEHLYELKKTLRQRLLDSPLGQPENFAKNLVDQLHDYLKESL